MEQNYTITKSNVECYKLRHQSGIYWADITIDSRETTGRIQIASDFGSWQNYWGACGKSFKEFLTTLDMHYFAGKVGATGWFDLNKTIVQYKEYVLSERRKEFIEADSARKMFDEIKSLFEITTSEFYNHMSNECPILMEHFDYCPDTVTDVTPEFRKFWEMVWGVFVNVLKEEMSVSSKKI